MTAPRATTPMELLARGQDVFERATGRAPTHAAQAPGRVNLIGEHTDYALGLVLPMAIDRWTVAVGARSEGPLCRVFSTASSEHCVFDLGIDPRGQIPASHWGRYPAGVLALLAQESGRNVLPALDIALTSSVPPGSGLSSSAALEVSIALLACAAWEIRLPPERIATICRRAENDYAGVPCGIMDQMISACAVEGHALLIDCRAERAMPVPLPPEDAAAWIVVDSGVRHALGSGAFAARRAAAERAAVSLGVASLRDATPWLLAESRSRLSDDEARSAAHIVSENQRVVEFAGALVTGDLEQAGRLMLASHVSLRDDLHVSCPELDAIVDKAMTLPGVYGSRMTGGGFGGCTVTLCRAAAEPEIIHALGNTHPGFAAHAVGAAGALRV